MTLPKTASSSKIAEKYSSPKTSQGGCQEAVHPHQILSSMSLWTCWKRKGPAPNCSNKIGSMESSQIFQHTKRDVISTFGKWWTWLACTESWFQPDRTHFSSSIIAWPPKCASRRMVKNSYQHLRKPCEQPSQKSWSCYSCKGWINIISNALDYGWDATWDQMWIKSDEPI